MHEKAPKKAELYRMVLPDHVCPFGVKSLELLERQGFEVEDHQLTTRAEMEAFKAEHQVETTPLTFIGGKPVGGYDELRQLLGSHN
jgi:glutaredoxin